jgi:hypothetical protein
MKIVDGCIIAALALAAGAWAEAARADEAYICDAGRVVYVKPGELEIKKLQDPCIAKYFEGTPTVAKSGTVSSVASTLAAPAPVSPVTAQAQPIAQQTIAPKSEAAGDFRNVRIINASPGSDSWFQHRR